MKKLLLTILLPCTLILGEFDKVGTTTAQFLKMDVGARAMGMGGGFVALVNDGTAPYWNPAGLTGMSALGITLHHNQWVLDISHDYTAVVIPTNRAGYFGISLVSLTAGEQKVTTVREPDGNGLYYTVSDMALGASYARKISDRFSFGMTLKYIRLAAYNENAQTVAVDIGSIYRTDFHGLRIGMSLSNFGGEIQYTGRDLIIDSDIDDTHSGNYASDANLITERWPLPLLIRMGIGIDVIGSEQSYLPSTSNRVTLAIDALHPNDSREHVNVGVEYAFREQVFLRSGYRLNYEDETFTLGGGVRIGLGSTNTLIDYAVFPLGPFGKTSQISISLTW